MRNRYSAVVGRSAIPAPTSVWNFNAQGSPIRDIRGKANLTVNGSASYHGQSVTINGAVNANFFAAPAGYYDRDNVFTGFVSFKLNATNAYAGILENSHQASSPDAPDYQWYINTNGSGNGFDFGISTNTPGDYGDLVEVITGALVTTGIYYLLFGYNGTGANKRAFVIVQDPFGKVYYQQSSAMDPIILNRSYSLMSHGGGTGGASLSVTYYQMQYWRNQYLDNKSLFKKIVAQSKISDPVIIIPGGGGDPGGGENPLPPAAAGSGYHWEQTFGDEFTGSGLDGAKWTNLYPWGARSNGANGEDQWYDESAVTVSNGNLVITATKQGMDDYGTYRNHKSGLIQTYGKFSQRYGYYEARMKCPPGKGMWPAFWLLPANPAFPWPPELDIMEQHGDKPYLYTATTHTTDTGGNYSLWPQDITSTTPMTDFNIFGMDWQSNYIDFYHNGVFKFRQTPASDFVIPNVACYVILNLAVGGTWPGYPDSSTPFPGYLLVDWVRVWQRVAN